MEQPSSPATNKKNPDKTSPKAGYKVRRFQNYEGQAASHTGNSQTVTWIQEDPHAKIQTSSSFFVKPKQQPEVLAPPVLRPLLTPLAVGAVLKPPVSGPVVEPSVRGSMSNPLDQHPGYYFTGM